MKITIKIDSKDLREQIEEGIFIGLNRDNWTPNPIGHFARPGEPIESVRRRWAKERANNIVAPIQQNAEMELLDA